MKLVFKLKTSCFNITLNCYLFKKFKLIKNHKFNHFIDIITDNKFLPCTNLAHMDSRAEVN